MSGGRGRRYGNEEEQSRKLFVGGLSFDTTDESLKDYFSQYGNMVDSVVIKEKNSTRSKGFGFVTYETEQEADKCMDNRPHELQGRTVDVKRAVSREESSRPGAHVSVKKIFVGGLKEHHKEDELRNFFSKFGPLDAVEVMVDKNTGKHRGFGFVTFADYDTVDKLVAKRIYAIDGSECEVKKALSRAEMEKAKADAEDKNRRSDGYGGGGGQRGGNGYGRGGGSNGYEGYGRGGGYGGFGDGGYGGARDGGYSGGYGGDGYGAGGYAYDGYGGGRGGGGYGGGGYGGADYSGGYGAGYGTASTNYGPMRASAQYTQRSSGPYGAAYGSGAGQAYSAVGYGGSAGGGYAGTSQGYAGANQGYGVASQGYGGASQGYGSGGQGGYGGGRY